MPRLVMKFGGTSVATVERIRNVARHVKREIEAGYDVAVVVSAMAGKTNELVGWVKDASTLFDTREYDTVVASGEQVTSGLLALTLHEMGLPARSWQGWQIPIMTSDAHGSARIAAVDGTGILQGFRSAGKWRSCPGSRACTSRRAGSRRSAAAARIRARWRSRRQSRPSAAISIPTWTASTRPTRASSPRRAASTRVSYEEMLEMASLGAKVLQVRSVELAMVHRVPTYVRSSFDDPTDPKLGTLICDEEDIMEQQIVTGIAYSKDEAQITLRNVADKPGVAASIFVPLADANINVDMIIQVVSDDTPTRT